MLALGARSWPNRKSLLFTIGLFTTVTFIYSLLPLPGSPVLIKSHLAPYLQSTSATATAAALPKGLALLFDSHTSMTPAQYMENVLRPLRGNDEATIDMFAYEDTLPISSTVSAMGHDLCIIDLDNRPFNMPGKLFNQTPMVSDSENLHGLSMGALSHWLYARIHGYKYYYVHVNDFPDRRNSWKKPTIISRILRNHKTCIYLDNDAIFRYLDLPAERILKHWDLDTTNNSLTLAIDPDLPHNKDIFGRLNLNTGFIVAQNNERTFEILSAWEECPNEGGRYPDCVKYRERRYIDGIYYPSDQGGFSDLIRYDYLEDIKELPCAEANGFPQDAGSTCSGHWVRHYWTGKDDWLIKAVQAMMPGHLLELFHSRFLQDKPNFFLYEDDIMPPG